MTVEGKVVRDSVMDYAASCVCVNDDELEIYMCHYDWSENFMTYIITKFLQA